MPCDSVCHKIIKQGLNAEFIRMGLSQGDRLEAPIRLGLEAVGETDKAMTGNRKQEG